VRAAEQSLLTELASPQGVRSREAASRALVLIAVEIRGENVGRARLLVIANATALTPLDASKKLIEPGLAMS
jgi:hypothetical protein